MTASEIGAQYATGLSRQSIERALVAAGKDMDHLAPADLGALEDFHTMGRIATGQLAELARVTGRDRVLDAGTGIGGTARFLAAHLRLPGHRRRPDRGVLRDGRLAQQAHRPRRADHRQAGGRDQTSRSPTPPST